jgi:hypothetical protein
MSKKNQEKPSTPPPDWKIHAISKIDIGTVKGGQHTSQALPKPEKPLPSKGNK